MSHGLKIYTSNGFVQVDASYKQHAVQSIGGMDGVFSTNLGYGTIEFAYINGNYVTGGALATVIGAAEKTLPYFFYNADTNRTYLLGTDRRYDSFARLKNGPVSASPTYGLKVVDASSQLLLNSNDSYFCARQEVAISVSTSSKTVTVPIDFGEYPTSSNVWLLCGMGPTGGSYIRSASGSYIYSANPTIYRSGNNIVCKVTVTGWGNTADVAIYPTSMLFTFVIGIIP